MSKKKNLSGKNYIDLGFGGMLFNNDHEQRKVSRYGKNGDKLIIDTAFTPDTGYFETGIIDERYYEDWVIVQEYATKKDAIKGHSAWVKRMTTNLPKELESVHGR